MKLEEKAKKAFFPPQTDSQANYSITRSHTKHLVRLGVNILTAKVVVEIFFPASSRALSIDFFSIFSLSPLTNRRQTRKTGESDRVSLYTDRTLQLSNDLILKLKMQTARVAERNEVKAIFLFYSVDFFDDRTDLISRLKD